MPRFFMALAAAFLLGITLAGCADQFQSLQARLIEQTKDLQHKPQAIWQETAERGGE